MTAKQIIEAATKVPQAPLMPGQHRIIAIIEGEGFVVKNEQTARELGAEHIVDKFYHGDRFAMMTILQ